MRLGLGLGLGLTPRTSAPALVDLVTTPYVSGGTTGTWAIDSTSITRNASATGQAILGTSPFAVVAGVYQVNFDVANLSGDTFLARFGGTSTGQISSNGSKTFNLTAVSTAKFTVAPWGGSAGEVTITNVHIYRIS